MNLQINATQGGRLAAFESIPIHHAAMACSTAARISKKITLPSIHRKH
jgi:hypothetical protein